jgi:hypothetical protein
LEEVKPARLIHCIVSGKPMLVQRFGNERQWAQRNLKFHAGPSAVCRFDYFGGTQTQGVVMGVVGVRPSQLCVTTPAMGARKIN